ncbi:MAG: RbsD/FucU domain-containing protein, partial [Fusobacteriaceae bacterium]
MKKSRLLNSELSYEISKIGHTAHLTLCDAGLPIPSDVKRIDLAIEKGYPSFVK